MSKTIDWEIIYTQESPKLLGICYRYVYDKALAEDLMHEAFIKAMQTGASFDSTKGNIIVWLKTIAIHTCINYCTRNKFKYTEPIENINFIEVDEEMNSDRNIIQEADFTQVELLATVKELPDTYQKVFNMYVIDKFSHKDIGSVLNISIGASKLYLFRARKKIQEILIEKAKYKQVKNKRPKVAFLFLLPFQQNYIDTLFQQKMLNYSLAPVKPLSIADIVNKYRVSENLAIRSHNPMWIKIIGGTTTVALVSYLIIPKAEKPVIEFKKPVPTVVKESISSAKPINSVQSPIKTILAIPSVEKESDTIRETIVITKEIIERDTTYVKK